MKRKSDLNPPLGFPGGPCYVVDRSKGAPNSKRIQDLLEQTGGIPKNLERSIYPERHIQKSRGKFKLSLSSHAQYRMDLRSISVPILTKAFASFEKWFVNIVESRQDSPEAATRFNRVLDDIKSGDGFTWHDKSTDLVLGIHYKPHLPTNTLLITTVYWKGSKRDNKPPAPGKGNCTIEPKVERRDPRDEDPLLDFLTRKVVRRWAAYQQPANELAGIRTFVDEKSDKGISDPNQPSSYLPSGSPEYDGYRGKALPSDHSKARTKHIPQPAFNAPGSSQDGNPIKMRTPSTPGAQYGHPYIDQGTTLHKRRSILAGLPIYAAFPYLSRTRYRGYDPDCDEVQDIIQRLKDGDRKTVDHVAKTLAKHPNLRGFKGVVVPAPRSKTGRPSLMLMAEALVRQGVGQRVEDAIVREIPVESSRIRRRRGLYGVPEEEHVKSMGVSDDHGIMPEESVLVVDDIVTSGSTIRAVGATLRANGHRGSVMGAAAGYNEPNPGEARCPVEFVKRASVQRVAARKQAEMTGEASVALMKWLSKVTQKLGVARHVYVVGGAIRNFLIDKPIKDIDMVVDSLSLKGDRDAAWVAQQIAKAIPTSTDIVTDALMVSKVFINGPWTLDGHDMEGEVIEIVNAREEVYGQDAQGNYLGHKPIRVDPTTLDVDVTRREFTFNTLMWRLLDLAKGPDKAEIIDLTGCGVRDLENREMRCPQDPDKTFREDPTRILRTIKFAFKYGFKLPPDVKAAARRQAKGLKRIPSKAWGVLRNIVLENPQYKKALQVMDDLGVIQVLREMVQEDATFAATLSNYAQNRNMGFMFELMDLGIPIRAPIGFLDGAQQKRLREITSQMGRDEAWEFLEKLRNPGEAYKDRKFFPTLMRELGIRNGKILAQKLEPAARTLLLTDPTLADRPAALRQRITDKLKTGKSAGLDRPFPTERQREQKGQAKRYYQRNYQLNRRRKLLDAHKRYRVLRNNPTFQLDKKRRNDPANEEKYKRRPPGATSVAERSRDYRERKKRNDVRRQASFYYHQYSSEDYPNEGAEDKGLPSAYSPTLRFPEFDDDHPATKMNDIRSVGVDGGPKNVPSIEKVRDRYARSLK